jgi:aspartyl-tRNA(Asn)/glutamyl-tRNA(Gln) amidotransferase subunit C
MSKLDSELLNYLTKLCRIDCTEKEQELLLEDLKKILTYVEQLQEVDTENVEPCNHVLSEIMNVMRDDVAEDSFKSELFMNNSPEQVDGMIRTPPVIPQT